MNPEMAAYVREQYELVRYEATTTTPASPRGYGVVLLMTRGISAWVEAVQTLMPRAVAAPTPSRAPANRLAWRPDDRADLTRVLASLVWRCTEEGAQS